ncbi:uncharacterized protein B0H18DRAFT_1021115 [Fomitopsis serialis]|uniref:uncharacterized protein n=1 Tax=Fomitopsis serialis TaxID=139415 RepID=UPI002007A12A|nr:uncharacterized protein B0H18DRAFT_1021115 [Neoantrodia serialis]KAH9921446.1 hypothetical protein B0H18DRAFT_1021115 [Neoantrodia serialis]
MARATRSAGQDTAPAPRKGGSKKRKRISNADTGEQPATKQQRTSESQEPPEIPSEQPDTDTPTDALGSGDVPLTLQTRKRYCSIDTQGLLDRVFPLPTESAEPSSGESTSTPTPSTSTQTFSFRTLLKDSPQYPLRVLRSAVQHLFPISSHPRSRPSEPAAQQLRFCNLALALLDQASFHSVPSPLEAQSIFPTLFQPPSTDEEAAEEAKPAPSPPQQPEDENLPTGHAELAAILPSASTSSSIMAKTLADYVRPRTTAATLQMPGLRHVSCGKFLDYGPYASFAPTFDQDGTEVGRYALGEVIWRQRQEATMESLQAADGDEVVLVGEEPHNAGNAEELDKALQSLVPAEEVARIKAALGSLEMEQAVQELLDKNARALLRLQRLQRLRLGAEGGGSSKVEEESEEWDTASNPPLVPPASVLRTLQRSLPLEGTEGWAATVPTTTPTTVIPVTPAKPAATSTAPYTPYSYNYQTPQYRGSYQYTPGQVQHQGQYSYPSYYQCDPGRVTPQPSVTPTTMPTNYASFFASSTQAQQPQRAVANTVTGPAAKPYQPGTWTGAQGGSGFIAPLPAHLRSAAAGAGASQPATPGASTPYPYYGNYQSTTSAAR